MVKIEWPDHPKFPVNLHTAIPGWFIYFSDVEKVKMYYLQQEYILSGKTVTPQMGLLRMTDRVPFTGVTTAHSFISKITQGR
jgi:hypothetical protein